MSEIKVLAALIPSEGWEGSVYSRPLSVSNRWPSSHSYSILPVYVPKSKFPPLGGHQSFWNRGPASSSITPS